MRTLNARRVPGVPEIPLAPLEQKNVRAGNVARDPYTATGAGACFDAVSRWYACDVDRFGFSALRVGSELEAAAALGNSGNAAAAGQT